MNTTFDITRDEIREQLRKNIPYESGKLLREDLHRLALRDYVPKRTSREYIDWMQVNLPEFDRCGGQSTNEPWYVRMFTVASQHVYGDCIEECLDAGMDKAESSHAIR